MKVIVLGSNGMLGRYVHVEMQKHFQTLALTREIFNAEAPHFEKLHLEESDVVINCIGIVKQRKANAVDFIKVNALFPHLLASYCVERKSHLLHVSTDCVFSGKSGTYLESDDCDALGIYGMSKVLGEPEGCTTLRTSIIGESTNKYGLLEWAKQQHRVEGYVNHFWNGVTCLELAKLFTKLIKDDNFPIGLHHVFSPSVVSKCKLIAMISEAYALKLRIFPVESDYCNRSLSTKHSPFEIAPLDEQLRELRQEGLRRLHGQQTGIRR